MRRMLSACGNTKETRQEFGFLQNRDLFLERVFLFFLSVEIGVNVLKITHYCLLSLFH